MDENNRSFLLAIVLSICVLIFWQFFYAGPKMEQEQARLKSTTEQSETATKTPSTAPAKPGAAPTAAGESSVPLAPEMGAPPRPGSAPNVANARVSAVKATARIKIDTPSLIGSISLRGARIDDLTLRDYRVAVAPTSVQRPGPALSSTRLRRTIRPSVSTNLPPPADQPELKPA